MKKLIFLSGLLAVMLVSCKKSKDDDEASAPTIPTTFQQKVLLEEFTGAWCGYCVRGAETSDEIDSLQAGKFIPVAVHSGDVMEIAFGGFLDTEFNSIGYPSGMINRTANGANTSLSDNQWAPKTSALVSLPAIAGLAIDASKITGDILTLKVRASINLLVPDTSFKLNIYLVESSVINASGQYSQHNYLSQSGTAPDPSSMYYNYPTLIPSFNHKHVLRKLITTGNWGESIPEASIGAGKEFSSTYTVDLTGFTPSKMHIVAFIDTYSADKTKHKVLNVQEATVGTNKNYD